MIPTAGLALLLTLISGVADAYGFTHASRVWRDGALISHELARASVGFIGGLTLYLLVLRYLDQLGVRSSLVQTLGWFAVTIIALAIISGDLTRWSRTQQTVGALTSVGVGYLLVSARA